MYGLAFRIAILVVAAAAIAAQKTFEKKKGAKTKSGATTGAPLPDPEKLKSLRPKKPAETPKEEETETDDGGDGLEDKETPAETLEPAPVVPAGKKNGII